MDDPVMIQHNPGMLGKTEIITALKRLVSSKQTNQRAIADVMEVAPPRVSEMFKGERDLSLDEAKRLVEHYQIGEPVTFNLDALKAILRGMLSGRVPDRDLEQEIEVLADALQYMLRRVSEHPALLKNQDALIEASRSATARRELPKH